MLTGNNAKVAIAITNNIAIKAVHTTQLGNVVTSFPLRKVRVCAVVKLKTA
jgi:hypothetical protein